MGKAINQELGDQSDGWDLPPLCSLVRMASAQFLQVARSSFSLARDGHPLEQTQAGESYIVNKTATQNSPEHLHPGKQGNRSNCGIFP